MPKKLPRTQVLCACGCGQTLTTPNERGQRVKYVSGHHYRGINGHGVRWNKGVAAQYRNAIVFCACGCGLQVQMTDKRRRKYAQGNQLWFNTGHRHKGQPNPRAGSGKKHSIETKQCACGCGTVIRKYDSSGRERTYLSGHNLRGKPGFMLGKRQPDSQRQKLSLIRAQNPTWKRNAHGKRTVYKGIMFMSNYEARFAESLDKSGLHWEYEPTQLSYRREGEQITRFYTPDFWVSEWQKYIEIKGFYTQEAKDKMCAVLKSNPNVEVWTKERLFEWLKRTNVSLNGETH